MQTIKKNVQGCGDRPRRSWVGSKLFFARFGIPDPGTAGVSPASGAASDSSTRRQDAGDPRTSWRVCLVVGCAAIALVTGCIPAGPRALLNGKKCLDRGDYALAIEELRAATQLMPTNALAFNYLGLAFHEAGKPAEAERAYLRALALNHDLTEVHYDLGCVLLSQSNKLEQAKSEFTAYTLRQPNAAAGWLKLGQTQLRSRELGAAERSLNEALRLEPKNPETLTAMGVVRWERKRPNEAAQLFVRALKEQPEYGPAMLNLAIVAQQDLNDPRQALKNYRDYLALKPTPANAQIVGATARQLEEELSPPPHEPSSNAIVPVLAPHTNTAKALETAHPATTAKLPVTNSPHVAPPISKTEPTNLAGVPASTNLPKPPPTVRMPTQENVETVKLGAEPVIKPAEDLASPPVPPRSVQTETSLQASAVSAASNDSRSPKRGFFQRINPINLFGRDEKSSGTLTSVPNSSAQGVGTSPRNDTTSVSSTENRQFPRYTHRAPGKPLVGDRSSAERAFAQGVQEQRARRLPEAIQAYRRATQADPSFYDAQYNLGLAASESGNLPLAMAAYETALAIEPESLDARYNFGLVLKQAGYVADAVNEFEKILAKYPNDGRTHLALGNLFAQQMQEPAKARQHYLAVLAVAPQSPQAGAIRYWLSDHPK